MNGKKGEKLGGEEKLERERKKRKAATFRRLTENVTSKDNGQSQQSMSSHKARRPS